MRTAIGVVAAAVVLVAAATAHAHGGNPNMRSEVESIIPATKGLAVEVLNYDDRLLLRNQSGEDVVVEDYDGRPYARVLAGGLVEVNTNSEAYYLNDDRYAQADVPEGLGDRPRWKEVDRTGRFEWHDHRMHWMAKSTPPQVRNEDERTPIFDWQVPLTVGGERGAIAGSLTWVPLPGGGGPPAGFWIATGALVALSLAFMVVRLRRLGRGEPRAPAGEAW